MIYQLFGIEFPVVTASQQDDVTAIDRLIRIKWPDSM
jgi:hypothetical protein